MEEHKKNLEIWHAEKIKGITQSNFDETKTVLNNIYDSHLK